MHTAHWIALLLGCLLCWLIDRSLLRDKIVRYEIRGIARQKLISELYNTLRGTDMRRENLMNAAHKAATEAYRQRYDEIRWDGKEPPKEPKEVNDPEAK